MHFYSVLLALTLTILFVSAKNIRQIDNEHDDSADESEMFHANDKYNPTYEIEARLLRFLTNRENQVENDRYETIGKRAKAIIKGDPREFMG
ncbi:hypothetical protein I4U23_001185 [Adineta vaga]|nr:hypothetical protein I4U23_001185 [Adineta vaga]